MNKCDVCGTIYNKENSPDGLNGYEIREQVVEDKRTTSVAKGACKKCYLKAFKRRYPDAEAPKL